MTKELIASILSDVHTCLPGVIVSYDGVSATVRPSVDKKLANGNVLNAPLIVMVPVCWPVGDINGGKALITVPLKPGDNVMLNFSERALENWLSGSDGVPDDPRQFDLSDCFATPLLRPNTMKADTENLSIQYSSMSMKVSPDGTITISNSTNITFNTPRAIFKNNVEILGNLKTNGNQTVDGDMTNGGIVFRRHVHDCPDGTTSEPR